MAVGTKTLAPARALRERVLRILREAAPRLRARGITRLSLFGSMARGEAGPGSDIDLLIEIDPDAGFGLSDLLDLQEEFGDLLGRPINFAFASEMRPWLLEWIENDRIGVFRCPRSRRGCTSSTSARPST
jgi:predicted nucleotidyltransferase